MLRREMGLTDKLNDKTVDQTTLQAKNKSKIASLAPYIAEIERRKKMKSVNKRSRKNINESSSKSFRIKQKSVTSLHKEMLNRTKEMANVNLIIKKIEEKHNKQRRTRSVQRTHDIDISKTIENKPSPHRTNNNFFNDLYARVKSKMDRERPLRKRQYQTLEDHRARSEQQGELNMYKISYTNIGGMTTQSKREPELDQNKRTEPPKKNNFRRNKYEVLQGSLGINSETSKVNIEKEQFLSDGNIMIDKKQSNYTINIEMDRLAQRQMENYYQQVITKQINRSIEKSTEKYFNYESYRPTKSKNQIEVYISTIKNPSLNKVSKSTNEKSDYKKEQTSNANNNEYLNYDFDFKNDEQNSMIDENNPSEQESTIHLKVVKNDEFQKQRKQVQIEFFNKPQPRLDWSEDQCKIDQI